MVSSLIVMVFPVLVILFLFSFLGSFFSLVLAILVVLLVLVILFHCFGYKYMLYSSAYLEEA